MRESHNGKVSPKGKGRILHVVHCSILQNVRCWPTSSSVLVFFQGKWASTEPGCLAWRMIIFTNFLPMSPSFPGFHTLCTYVCGQGTVRFFSSDVFPTWAVQIPSEPEGHPTAWTEKRCVGAWENRNILQVAVVARTVPETREGQKPVEPC